MNENTKELKALDAYLRLLAGKGAGDDVLAHRKESILRMLPLLQQNPSNGNLYRDAVEAVLQVMDRNAWPLFLNVAREYYYFWADDIKTIVAMHAEGDFDITPPEVAGADENIQSLWVGLDAEVFSVTEKWTLKGYTCALREEGAEKSVVDTRCRLVKLLLIRLRGLADNNARSYRMAVNATLPLFAMRETRLLFLIVVREFYYFWIGDPDAPGHIVLDVSEG